MQASKRIALITTWFPPQESVATNRMLAFAEFLSETFEVEVFCLAQEEKTIKWKSNILVHYSASSEFLERLKDITSDGAFLHKIKVGTRIILSKVIPNPLAKWQKSTLSKLKQVHSQNAFDCIISSYSPQEAHLAAIEFKKEFPTVPWIADMRDEKGKNRYEEIDGIPVHRTWIHVSKSKGIVSRLLNYFNFVWSSYWKGRKMKHFDYLLVESPPLFLGYSAMALAKKLNAKLIFNVSDLWPESAEKLGIVTNKRLLNLAYNLEAKCYTKAHLITGQTQGIVDDIRSRFPEKRVYWLPNGVDVSFYNPTLIQAGNFREKNRFSEEAILFFYGGILGHAQGLEVILNAANLLRENSKIQFILQGSGPEKELLLELKKTLNLTNVHFLEPVSKKEMPAILKSIDVALVPLKNLPLFQGAIPSKVFEALAMEVPLLLGVDGEAKKHFIEKGKAGLFFQPEDAEDLAKQAIFLAENLEKRIEMGKNARMYVSEHFDRNKIAEDFLKELNKKIVSFKSYR